MKAMLEVVSERDAGLLVFGPDLTHHGRRRFQLVRPGVCAATPTCLVWIAPDG